MSSAPGNGTTAAVHGVDLVCPACRGWRDDAWHQSALSDRSDELVCRSCDASFASVTVGNHRIATFHTEISESAFDESIASFEAATWASNHWGMFTQPPLVEPQLAWLADLLAGLDDLPDGPILVLGSATCGVLPALPRDRDVVCMDAHPGHLAMAAELANGRAMLPYAKAPEVIAQRPVALPDDAQTRLQKAVMICGDALNPPFGPDEFALIVCLNLLDSIARPTLLMSQCEALVKPTGAVVFASPYNWAEHITAHDERLDTILAKRDDFELAVESLATGAIDPGFMAQMRLQWCDRKVQWTLRAHDRMKVCFAQHAFLLRRLAAPPNRAVTGD